MTAGYRNEDNHLERDEHGSSSGQQAILVQTVEDLVWLTGWSKPQALRYLHRFLTEPVPGWDAERAASRN